MVRCGDVRNDTPLEPSIMARCEDFPCCGHEAGCCPRFSESGEQLDMVCVCGKRLPIDNPVSICDACLKEEDDWDDDNEEDWDEDDDS